MARASIEAALAAFGKGDPVIVLDSSERKDECDLVFPADQATKERMAFAIRHGTGIVYVVSEQERLEHFGLKPVASVNTERFGMRGFVSTTYLPGSSTGLSAGDRAATARALCNLANPSEVFSKPGHMFPVVPDAGGVLGRAGHTEAAFDLCRLSGRTPVACLTELTREDGSMLRVAEAAEFAQRHRLLCVSVEDLAAHRREHPEFPNAPNPDSIPSIRGLKLPTFDGAGLRIGIVSARWNASVCEALEQGAREALAECNVRDIAIEYVAGSYEIPAAATVMLASGRFDGVICIGCLIKGQSMHFEYVAEAVTQGIMRLNLDYKLPVIYGILSVLSEEQAKARAGLDSNGHNSGKDWAYSVVESCLLQRRYRRASRL